MRNSGDDCYLSTYALCQPPELTLAHSWSTPDTQPVLHPLPSFHHCTEMEFLDIDFTKDSNYKKIRETRKLESIHEQHFLEQKNYCR